MVDFEQLSGDEKDSYEKWFILGDLFVYAILFFASLGIVSDPQVYMIYFFIFFGLVLATVPSIIKYLNRDKQDLLIDTVTIEEEDSQIASPLANWRVQLGIGIVISILASYAIISNQAIFVQYPTFAISVPFLSGTGALIFNSLIAAIAAGWIENRVFFSTAMPTIYNLINQKYDSIILAMIGSIIITTSLFGIYHLWRYSNSVVSLQAVLVFGLMNCLLLLFTRSVVGGIQWHISNNFVGAVLQISRSMFGIVI